MKRSTLVIGMVIGGHAVAALLLLQGCQTVHREPTEKPLPSDPVTALPVPADPPPVPAPPRPTVPFEEPTTTYTVRPGDSISAIASRYSLNPRDIAALNQLADPDRIRVGQKLLLPGRINLEAPVRPERPARPDVTPEGRQVHVVQSGETLSHIALRYKVSSQALKRANNLTDANLIRVGQELVVPDAARRTQAPAPDRRRPDLAPQPDPDLAPIPSLPETTIEPLPPDPVDPPPAVDRQAETAAGSEYRIVTVQPNEDLITLAVRWNVTPSLLRQINGLTDNKVHPGQTLKIPMTH